MVFLYAATYFRNDRRLGSLLLTLVAFAVSMLGLVTADDAITLFVFWEGTTITSWLLVGFDHERAVGAGGGAAGAAGHRARRAGAPGRAAADGRRRRHLPAFGDERRRATLFRASPALPGDLLRW